MKDSRPESKRRRSLTFGIERIGLVAIKFRLLAGLIALAAAIVAGALGIPRMEVDDSLSQLFRTDTEEFERYEALADRFPSSEFDVVVTIAGETLLERGSIDRLRDISIDLRFVDGVDGLISMFSARRPPSEPGGVPEPLFPAELPEGEAYRDLVAEVRDNALLRGTLLSEDGQLTIMVVALDREAVRGPDLGEVVPEIRSVVEGHLEEADLSAGFTGTPVMQLEIRRAVERDQLIYNAAGLVVGCILAAIFFGRLSFILIAAAPPALAVVLALGALGWLGLRLNMFLNVMTPLIMVLAFSDSMQLAHAGRERLLAGDDLIAAWKKAVLEVGPANVLTTVAVGLSFATLLLSQSHLIRTFGAAGAVSAAISFLAVMTVQPPIALLLLKRNASPVGGMSKGDVAIEKLRRFCRGVAGLTMRRARLYSVLCLVLVGGLSYLYATMEPRYRLADQVPDREHIEEANRQLGERLGGAQPLHILIELPSDVSPYDRRALSATADAHALLEKEAGVGNVWSTESFRRWLNQQAGIEDVGVLRDYAEMLPEHLKRRFVSEEGDAVLVTGRIPDVDAGELLPIVDRLDTELAALRERYGAYEFAVTGLAAVAARNSASMIRTLSTGLAVAMAVACVLLGLAFRSALVSVIAIMPGIFPIVVSAGVLSALGEGMQFASVVALTVAFGLGLSSTIHYLNRLHLGLWAGRELPRAVGDAAVLVGPALILTTLVLTFGLGVTLLSDLPSLRLFGWLSGFTLLAALAGDLIILPATAIAASDAMRRLRAG